MSDLSRGSLVFVKGSSGITTPGIPNPKNNDLMNPEIKGSEALMFIELESGLNTPTIASTIPPMLADVV